MTPGQYKLIEIWIMLAGVALVCWLFQDNAWVARGVFVPAVLYVIWNWDAIRSIERVGPTPNEVIKNNVVARVWVFFVAAVEAALAFGFLLSGRNLGDHIVDYWPLLLALIAPIALPLFLSQVALFRRLRHVES